MRITFATINTWKCDGDYDKRLELLHNQLNKHPIDVLCCQEVFSLEDYTVSTKSYLEKNLSLQSFSFPTRKKQRLFKNHNVSSFSGLCVFTNMTVIKEKQLYLSTHINDGERTAQLISIVKDKKKIAVINTHLTHLKNESELRSVQINEILQHVDFKYYDVVFICGDLNDTPSSKVIKTITEKHLFKPALKKYPPTRNYRCIDYIFYKSNVEIDVRETKIILNEPSEEDIFPSDHFGVLATFQL